jgi:hypothetical protein
MSKLTLLAMVLFVCISTGCISLEEGSSVRVVNEAYNIEHCVYIDFVETSSSFSVTPGDAYNQARNQTARLGGNVFQILTFISPTLSLAGNAYLCSDQ